MLHYDKSQRQGKVAINAGGENERLDAAFLTATRDNLVFIISKWKKIIPAFIKLQYVENSTLS